MARFAARGGQKNKNKIEKNSLNLVVYAVWGSGERAVVFLEQSIQLAVRLALSCQRAIDVGTRFGDRVIVGDTAVHVVDDFFADIVHLRPRGLRVCALLACYSCPFR